MTQKKFNTQDATMKLFTHNTQDTHSTQETQKTQKTPKRKYRYNLTLDADLNPFLHKISWEQRTSMTQYLNDLIRKEMNDYIKAGGSLEGWEDDE